MYIVNCSASAGYSGVHNSIETWMRVLGVEITVVPRFMIPLLTVACRTATGRRGGIEYAGACHENLSRRPLGRLGRTRGCCPLGWQRRIAALGLRSMPSWWWWPRLPLHGPTLSPLFRGYRDYYSGCFSSSSSSSSLQPWFSWLVCANCNDNMLSVLSPRVSSLSS